MSKSGYAIEGEKTCPECGITCNGVDEFKCSLCLGWYGKTKPTNPKDRIATYRLDLSLFPAPAVAYGALAMTEGHAKYGAYNWRSAGVMWSIYDAAARRHLDKFRDGEECDPVTRVPHLASALACIAILIDSDVCHMLNDDRPPKAPTGLLLNSLEEHVAHLYNLFKEGPARFTQVGKEGYKHDI